jgi:V/A-type H+-transporting ATPase subunit C
VGFLSSLRDPMTYGHAVGRIRVRENSLLSRQRIDRLIEAADLEEQIQILADSQYGEFLEGVRTAEGVEEALEKFLAKVYDFLQEICPNEDIVSFLRLKYDFHNLKVLLKTKYQEKSAEHVWSKMGFLNVKWAEQLIAEEKYDKLPVTYGPSVAEAAASFDEFHDAQEIDIILDQGLYHEWLNIAKAINNDYVNELTRSSIDIANLKTFLRAKNLRRKKEFADKAIFAGGFIERKKLIALFPRPLTELVTALRISSYGDILSEVVEGEEKAKLALFDKLADNYLLLIAKKAKYVAVGMEPLFGYIFAIENEVTAVRSALLGKLSGIPKATIKERVRELYV